MTPGSLAAADTFYFGDAIGESGTNPANAVVNSTDEIETRSNPKTFLNPALVTDRYDFNRDGLVNATDQILARAMQAPSPLDGLAPDGCVKMKLEVVP